MRQQNKTRRRLSVLSIPSDLGRGRKVAAGCDSRPEQKGPQSYVYLFLLSPLTIRLESMGISGYKRHFTTISFLNPFKVLGLARIFKRENVGILVTRYLTI